MTDVINEAFKLYRDARTNRRSPSEWTVGLEAECVVHMQATPERAAAHRDNGGALHLFGMPVRLDPELPDDVIEIRDRRGLIGRIVNVGKPIPLDRENAK